MSDSEDPEKEEEDTLPARRLQENLLLARVRRPRLTELALRGPAAALTLAFTYAFHVLLAPLIGGDAWFYGLILFAFLLPVLAERALLWALELPNRLAATGALEEAARISARAERESRDPDFTALMGTYAAWYSVNAGELELAKAHLARLSDIEESTGLPDGVKGLAYLSRAHVALLSGDWYAVGVYAEAGLEAPQINPVLTFELTLYRNWARFVERDPTPYLEDPGPEQPDVLFQALGALEVMRYDLVLPAVRRLEVDQLARSRGAAFFTGLLAHDLVLLGLDEARDSLASRVRIEKDLERWYHYWIGTAEAVLAQDPARLREEVAPLLPGGPDVSIHLVAAALLEEDPEQADELLAALVSEAPAADTLPFFTALVMAELDYAGRVDVGLELGRRVHRALRNVDHEESTMFLRTLAGAERARGDRERARELIAHSLEISRSDQERIAGRNLLLWLDLAEGRPAAELVSEARRLHTELPWLPGPRFSLAAFLLEAGERSGEPAALMQILEQAVPRHYPPDGRVRQWYYLCWAAKVAGDETAWARRSVELRALPEGGEQLEKLEGLS